MQISLTNQEIAHPKLWGPIGGKLEWEDLISHPITRLNHNIPNWGRVVERLLRREAMEEAGIKIKNFHYLEDLAYLRSDKVPVVCVKFAAQYAGGKIKLASDFADFAWVDKKEVDKYQTIDGIAEEIKKTTKIFSV